MINTASCLTTPPAASRRNSCLAILGSVDHHPKTNLGTGVRAEPWSPKILPVHSCTNRIGPVTVGMVADYLLPVTENAAQMVIIILHLEKLPLRSRAAMQVSEQDDP